MSYPVPSFESCGSSPSHSTPPHNIMPSSPSRKVFPSATKDSIAAPHFDNGFQKHCITIESEESKEFLDSLFRGYHVMESRENAPSAVSHLSIWQKICQTFSRVIHRCWSITMLLPTILVLQVLVTATVVFTLTYVNSLNSVQSLSSQLVATVNGAVSDRVNELLGIPPRILESLEIEGSLHHIQLTADSISGNFTEAKYEESTLYTLRMLKAYPSAALIYMGNDYGDTIGFSADDGSAGYSYSRVLRATYGEYFPPNPEATFDEYCQITGNAYNLTFAPTFKNGTVIPGVEPSVVVCGFDSRTRPWYSEAKKKRGKEYFTEPYLFVDNIVGLSVSKGVYSSVTNDFLGVVSVDFKMSGLNLFLEKVQVGKSGRAFLVSKKGEFLASNKLDLSSGDGSTLNMVPIETIPDAVISDTAQVILQRYSSFSNIRDNSNPGVNGNTSSVNFRAIIAGESSFVYISHLNYAENVEWIIVCVLPESDFLSNVYTSNIITIATTCVFVFLSIIVALMVTGMIIFPLFNLGRNMQKAAQMQLSEKDRYLPVLYEVHQIQVTFASLRRALRFFKKFIPSIVIKRVMLEDEYSATRVTEAEDMSMMFADIEGFSTFAESLSPNDLLEVMSIAMESMSQIVLRNGGLVDAFVGDAIIALFGIPEINDDPQHATHAVLTGLQCVRRMEELDLAWKSFGLKPLRIRVGVNSGRCCVGMLGSREKIQFSALGSAMNLAARLEPLNKEYGSRMLISEHTHGKVRDSIVCRVVDRVIVKGLTIATNVYEPISERSEATPAHLKVEQISRKIFDSLQEKRFEECFSLIDQAMECKGFANDPVLETIRKKVRHIRDGKKSFVTKMETK